MAKLKKKSQLKKVKAKKKATGRVAKVRKKTMKRAQTVKRTSAQRLKNKTGSKAKTGEVIAVASMVGHMVPEIVLPATGNKNVSFKDFSGQKIILYFYPKDHTSGCTVEGNDFSRLDAEFHKENAVVLGVSRDSIKSHESFKDKQGFRFDLLSDENESLCRAFHVIQMKSLYGRQYEGIERSTFVISEQGRILKEWRKVKVEGHAREVLDFVKTLARS